MAGRQGAGHVSRAVARWARGHLALWIVAATAVDAALLALVAVLIALPGQSAATISFLILCLLLLLVLSIVFPVAGHLVQERERVAGQEHERRERIDRLLAEGSSARLPRLSELTDDMLGATPTRYSIGGDARYVTREEADKQIRGLLTTPGPPYPFVIVWGTTKAGKSRTLAEGLRAAFAHDPVVLLPRDGQALAELARLGVDDLVENLPAVLVLDDLSPAGLEALTTEVLDGVRGWAVIAATMTAQRRQDVLETGSKVGAAARTALERRSRQYELGSGPPDAVEKAEAERLYPGERFDGSIAETLVGGRELIARYKASHDGNPAGCAVMRAAIDCRRAGLSRPVAEAELHRLFPLYLHAVRIGLLPTNKQFTDGIQWATRPVTSQVALLRRANPGQQPPSWTVLDHAVTADEGHGDHPSRPIPAETWAELIDVIPAQDTFAVGMAAYTNHEITAAVTAFRIATTCDDDQAPWAAHNLGFLLQEQGDVEGARAAYQQAIDSGHADAAPGAWGNLGALLEEQGDVEGARAAYQQAIDSGHADQAPRPGSTSGPCSKTRVMWRGRGRPTSRPSTPATPTRPPEPGSTSASCFNSRVMWRGRGRPTSRPSTPATPTRPPEPGSTSGPCSKTRVMWRGRGRPTSRPSTPATPTRPPEPGSTWGPCSKTRVMWRGRGRPTSRPSTPATPTRPPGGQ